MLINSPKLKLIIVEDEPAWIGRIKSLLIDHFSDVIIIVGINQTISAAIDAINTLNPDILILDLKVQNRWSWEIISAFSQPDFFIIFISTYVNLKARCEIERSSLGFIEKSSLSEASLRAYINKALSVNRRIQMEKNKMLFRVVNNEDIISVDTTLGEFYIINRAEIVYVEVKDKVVIYHTIRGHVKTWSSLGNTLILLNSNQEDDNNYRFFQIHRDTIINLMYFTNLKSNFVEMDGLGLSATKLTISRNCELKLRDLIKYRLLEIRKKYTN